MIANLMADARHIPLKDGIVQCVVTSPPYFGLRDYGIAHQIGLERTPEDYVAEIVTVFREVWRVIRDDATVWLNLGDSYNACYRWGGERRITDKQASNHGSCHTAGPRPIDLPPKNLLGIPWRVAFALQADGWYLRSDIIWAKLNPMPESVTDRPTKSHEYVFLLTKRERYYYDAEAISEPAINAFNVIPLGPKSGMAATSNSKPTHMIIADRRNCRDVWNIAASSDRVLEAHFATFPQKLVEPCILAGSRRGDLVLDPFSGSGTVGRVCARFQRRFVGCDINPAYFEIAERRQAEVQVEMFA